jgi:hypothetical protein
MRELDGYLNCDKYTTVELVNLSKQVIILIYVVYINERRISLRHGWQVHAYHAHYLCGAVRYAQDLLRDPGY